MTSIKWQQSPSSDEDPHAASPNNIWFGISVGLMGVIVGFIVGTFL